jgi:ABC-type transporter Mla subunit MlaD
MKLKKRLSIVAVSIALVGGALAATGVATATTPTTTYYACLSHIGGILYNVDSHLRRNA